MLKASRVLVIAGHPDDEVLGCGATISKMSSKGATIQVLFVSDGESSRIFTGTADNSTDEINKRKTNARAAAEILGTLPPLFLDYPDNQLDTISSLELSRSIEAVVLSFAPNYVFTHSRTDLNVDHRVIHEVVQVALRTYVTVKPVTTLFFEIGSSTEQRMSSSRDLFNPSVFVDVEESMGDKCAALEAYSSELRNMPNLRSLEGQVLVSKYRGAQAGLRSAEAFECGRLYLD